MSPCRLREMEEVGPVAVSSRIQALSSTRALAGGVLWNGLGRGIPLIAALFTTPFLLHHLGIDRWALFSLALSVAGSFGIFDFGVSAALTRALAERIGTPEEAEAPSLIVTSLVALALTGAAGAGLAYLLVPLAIEHLLNVSPELRDEAVATFRLLAFSGPLIIINAALWGILSAYQRFRLTTLMNIPVSAIYYVGPVVALLAQNSLVWVVATLIIARSVQAVICGILALHLIPGLRKRPKFEFRLLFALFRMGAWFTVSNTLWPVMLYVDRFTVGAMLSLAAVSYYATPLDLVARLIMVPMVIAGTLFPAVATSYRTMPERARALLRMGSLITIIAVFPVCLLMGGLANELLSWWLGADFAAGARTVLVILAVGMFVNCVSVLPSTVTDAVGRPDISATILVIQLVLFPPVIILLARSYGIDGVAAAWTLRALFNLGARLLGCRRVGPSAAPVAPKLLGLTLFGVTLLVICPLIGPIMARFGAMACSVVALPLIAAVTLLDAREIAQFRQAALKRLPRLALPFSLRRT